VPFIDSKHLDVKEPLPGWEGRFFHSENLTLVYYKVSEGASVHEHSHPNDEVWNVIEGELEVTIDGEAYVAGPGCAAVIPPNVPHSVRALTDARAIVVDHPRRDSVGGIDVSG
jgi:quercetin dioxygenase-like cupin family protein